MFGASYQIARVWGIPVKIHISLIILLAFVGLRGGLSAGREYGWATGGVAVVANVMLMMLVFTSVALHELGHSFIAIRKGCRVRQITLMIIGGAAQMERIPRRPRDEILMAAAGPFVSLVLGFMTMGLGTWMYGAGWPLPGFLFFNLGLINLVLAGFNLLPAFPMDGGRILRAALSGRMGRLQATYTASRVGKLVAVLMGMYGIMPPANWFLVAIAFFIYTAAGAEYRMLQMQEALDSTRRFFGGQDDSCAEDAWPQMNAPSHEETDAAEDDGVIVGPPPYRKGPAVRVDIRREQEGQGRDSFFYN